MSIWHDIRAVSYTHLMIVEFTDGDMSMLPQLMEIGKFEGAKDEWKEKQAAVNTYIEAALDIYFAKQGCAPFQEE